MPVFFVTRPVPREWVYEGSPFNFLTVGVESAAEEAKDVAGDNDVGVGGHGVAQQCIGAGLVDEVGINLVPVPLGEGVGFLDHLRTGPIELVRTKVIGAPGSRTSGFASQGSTLWRGNST